jgi:hypothetical protein
MDAPETQYVTVGDSQIAYQVLGDGPIDLVYHHGFCHLDLQSDVVSEAAWNRGLASFSRLILFDRPSGRGRLRCSPSSRPGRWR